MADKMGRLSRLPSHAAPSSSGVTATGENELVGLACTKPKPLGSSVFVSVRSV
jgi:hypothetical protein